MRKIPNEEANDGAHKIASEICEEKNRVIITEWMEREIFNYARCETMGLIKLKKKKKKKPSSPPQKFFFFLFLLSIHFHCKRSKQECHRTGKIVKIFLCFAKTQIHTHTHAHTIGSTTERDLFNLIFGQSSSFFLHETFLSTPPTTSKEKTNKNS